MKKEEEEGEEEEERSPPLLLPPPPCKSEISESQENQLDVYQTKMALCVIFFLFPNIHTCSCSTIFL